MDIPTLLSFLAALLFTVLSTAQAEEKLVYFKLGGGLTLEPAPIVGPITSVSWKHNGDLAAEWVEPTVPLGFYGVLKGRATMNKLNGVLYITNMSQINEGLYAVEMNDQLQANTFWARMLKKVPDPKVEVSPLICSSESENCTLTCAGDLTGAGPITFYWKLGEKDWEKGGRDRQILKKDEGQGPKIYSCSLENPVSRKGSPGHANPFSIQPPKPPKEHPVGLIVGVLILLIILVVAVVLIFVFRNREPIHGILTRLNILPGEFPPPESNGGTLHPEANSNNDPSAERIVTSESAH